MLKSLAFSTALTFALWRLINRLHEGFLPPVGQQPTVLELGVKVIHWVFLLLPFGMLITGVMLFLSAGRGITLFGWQLVEGSGVANEALREQVLSLHETGETIFIVAALLHVAGALKQHVIDRDDTLRRIIRRI